MCVYAYTLLKYIYYLVCVIERDWKREREREAEPNFDCLNVFPRWKTYQLTNLGVIHFTEKGIFLTLFTFIFMKSKSLFFHNILSLLTIALLLLHCFHPKTSFRVHLQLRSSRPKKFCKKSCF